MSTTTDRPIRFVVIEEPYYSDGDIHKTDWATASPVIGDVVETNYDRVDDDGDRLVSLNGSSLFISDAVLVRLDVLISERGGAKAAEPLADWERELLTAVDPEGYHGVTLARPVVKPNKLADVLRAHGMSAETVEVLTALAVLRSAE